VVGDAVLRAVTQYLLANKRWYDHIYRYRGGRLLLSTPATPVLLAASLAETLRSGISEQAIPSNAGGRNVQITVSVGVSALDATLTVEEAIARAEEALSRAKAAGRNCVEVFGKPERAL
jgi:diguanylate cyclase (GGDEF)-like protein